MKSTGIVRKVEELGRVVIPIELRRILEIDIKYPLEVYRDENRIIFKKYRPKMTCSVTGDVSEKICVWLTAISFLVQRGHNN